MRIFLFALELLKFSSTNFFIEEIIELFDIFLFDAFILSDISLRDIVLINDVIEFLGMAQFDFDPDDVEAMFFFADGVEECISIEYV